MIKRIVLTLFPVYVLIWIGAGKINYEDNKPENILSFENYIKKFYLDLDLPGLNYNCFEYALKGYYSVSNNKRINKKLLTIIDFTKPSIEERLFIIDLKEHSLIHKSLVAHGKNSGLNFADTFSNERHSNMSSLGFYLTGESYMGKHGYSLRLIGLEKGFNNLAYERAVVIHSANYVSNAFINKYGRLGRSFGCPAIPADNHKQIIDLIKDGSCLFIYYPDSNYLANSELLSESYMQLVN